MEASVAHEDRAKTKPPAAPGGAGLALRALSDEALTKQIARGSDRAFEVLYWRHQQQLSRYCRSLVGNEADTQDALQSTMTNALLALREKRRDAPLKPWLFRIAHNESISLLRRRQAAPQLDVDDVPESTLAAGPSARAAHEVAEQRERLTMLLADLEDLPERQRAALVMRELSGLSHEEISTALEVSLGVAKQTVLEARRSLAEFTEGRAMACDQIQQLISDGDRRTLRSRRVRAHLRDCSSCAAFAEAIDTRKTDLLALSPALPATASAALIGALA
ncbi:MAG: RNA polymerase sigma factor, partial [Solirubrobacterales bacterium]|nr:RNA polymerase sigma factor [Solirubrobacterales bacterium]